MEPDEPLHGLEGLKHLAKRHRARDLGPERAAKRRMAVSTEAGLASCGEVMALRRPVRRPLGRGGPLRRPRKWRAASPPGWWSRCCCDGGDRYLPRTAAKRVRIPAAEAERMVAHARAGYPNEACGAFLGRGQRGDAGGAAGRTGRRTTPRVRYQIEPEDLIRLDREARADGLEIIGYFHSHPDHSGAAFRDGPPRGAREPVRRRLSTSWSGSRRARGPPPRPGCSATPPRPSSRSPWRSLNQERQGRQWPSSADPRSAPVPDRRRRQVEVEAADVASLGGRAGGASTGPARPPLRRQGRAAQLRPRVPERRGHPLPRRQEDARSRRATRSRSCPPSREDPRRRPQGRFGYFAAFVSQRFLISASSPDERSSRIAASSRAEQRRVLAPHAEMVADAIDRLADAAKVVVLQRPASGRRSSPRPRRRSASPRARRRAGPSPRTAPGGPRAARSRCDRRKGRRSGRRPCRRDRRTSGSASRRRGPPPAGPSRCRGRRRRSPAGSSCSGPRRS